jgi:BirA family transcriptional regulator, biotin operon repressor / biotin---[acetyl-CoA-carboxylase] ligase
MILTFAGPGASTISFLSCIKPTFTAIKLIKKILSLTFNTLFVGNVVQHFAETPSTNVLAVEAIAKTKPTEGTVISADFQSAGKGQIGRNWHSSPGQNLLQSLILYPHWLAVRDQFALSQAMALGVADAVSDFSTEVALVKWPNDIYLANRKVAGILIQNGISGTRLQWSVVGIGLNVNEVDFPSALPLAGSLCQHLGAPLERAAVQAALFQRLEQRYLQLKADPERIRQAYLEKLYRYQSWHPYQRTASGAIFQGQIIGVQTSGKLDIQMEDGIVQCFDLKEVVFL